ncbi:MAG: hypothetical protein ABII00_18800 [Elusimicrobiota bacterium]
MKRVACAACLLLLCAAGAESREQSLRERYFQAGWATVDAGAEAPVPDAPGRPLPAEDDPSGGTDAPVRDLHNPIAHMFFTRQAYLMYAAQFSGGELSRYIGEFDGNKPPAGAHDTVLAGTYDEDQPRLNPFGDVIPNLAHFWDCRKGPFAGIPGSDSAVNRAQKFFTGGYGLDGKYDRAWGDGRGRLAGKRGMGAVALYRAGEKNAAYWYLGHVAHLLEDLTVPAHAHRWAHLLPGSAVYEEFIKSAYPRWSEVPSGPVDSFETLYDLFLRTDTVTLRYDTGSGSGPLRGRNGTVDAGRRRAGGFTQEELDEEGDALIPLAIRSAAALFVYFYRQVDEAPPRVTLSYPASADPEAATLALGPAVELSASAVDAASGVDRKGFRFLHARRSADGWSAWGEVPGDGGPRARFAPEPGVLYAVKATARDAAGNLGESAVGYLRAAPAVASAASGLELVE